MHALERDAAALGRVEDGPISGTIAHHPWSGPRGASAARSRRSVWGVPVQLEAGVDAGDREVETFQHLIRKRTRRRRLSGGSFDAGGSPEDLRWINGAPAEPHPFRTGGVWAGPAGPREIRVFDVVIGPTCGSERSFQLERVDWTTVRGPNHVNSHKQMRLAHAGATMLVSASTSWGTHDFGLSIPQSFLTTRDAGSLSVSS